MGLEDILKTMSGDLTAPNKGINDFFMGNESEMNPFNKMVLQQLLKMMKSGGGLEGNELFGGGSDFLQKLLSNDPQQMQQFQQPYLENFQQNIVPDIANRFAGMGTGASGLSSSGFQQTLAQAGRGLQSDLASMRGQQQLQGLPQALQYAQQPISNKLAAAQSIPGQYFEKPGQAGFLQNFAQGVGQGAGKIGASYLTGGM
jgi:hypothetical protein